MDESMNFWIIAALMAVSVAGLLGLALLRGRRTAEPAAAYDLRVYREQLDGVDRDLARGVIAEADAERLRTEISRRILAADARIGAAGDTAAQSRVLSMTAVAVLAVALVGGSLLLYRSLGAPGYGDLPRSLRLQMADIARTDRPAQAEAEARLPPAPPSDLDPAYAELVQQLRDTVADRPEDIQGHALLARHEAASGNFRAAYAAQSRMIELLQGDVGADEHSQLAEMMIMAAGGYVSPEAEAALRRALERDPTNGPGRYYWGLMLGQIGRPDLAFRLWDQTLRQGEAGTGAIEAIRAQIPEMAIRAGVDYTLPPIDGGLSGPSAEDMRAAAQMSAEERMEMIRGMVEGLSERLASEGGSPEEWARLIGALGVLGETDRARAVYDEALGAFAGSDAALGIVRNAGRQAGFTE